MGVEWVAVPLLERAVNALFDAGQTLLKGHKGKESSELAVFDADVLAPDERERMLRQRVSELTVETRAAEIESLIEQIDIHQTNLNRATRQSAMWGEALVPPIIANTMDSETEKLRAAVDRLRVLLGQLAEGS